MSGLVGNSRRHVLLCRGSFRRLAILQPKHMRNNEMRTELDENVLFFFQINLCLLVLTNALRGCKCCGHTSCQVEPRPVCDGETCLAEEYVSLEYAPGEYDIGNTPYKVVCVSNNKTFCRTEKIRKENV